MNVIRIKKEIYFFIIIFILFCTHQSLAYSISFYDDQGKHIKFLKQPERVISLIPGITEMIFKMGAGDRVCGVTYFDTFPGEATSKNIVGGFYAPSIEKIQSLKPDCIFVSERHQSMMNAFSPDICQVVVFKSTTVQNIYHHLKLLGQILNCQDKAIDCISSIQNQLAFISKKIESIPEQKRKRVIRLMGNESIMTPGIDSFQNEFIRLAGGIPHSIHEKGHIIPVTLNDWKSFNPQVIYGCSGDRDVADHFFQRPGWKDVDAVKNASIYYFPCELTCRASTHSADFVTWLSAILYPELFEESKKQIRSEKIIRTKKVELPLSFVNQAKIAFGYVSDLECKSLIIDFKKPQSILSTLEGPKDNVQTVVNHYFQPAFWQISHNTRLPDLVNKICMLMDRPKQSTSVLLTGADMENLAVVTKKYQDIEIYALVTAGVKSNAMRLSKDTGFYYKPGTINMIILSNRKLSPKAMARALITATEAKTAALWDMDIRSSYAPLEYPATGTGTDNIIVVQGDSGSIIDQTGGHTKAGELIAKAVYDAVQQSIFKQNSMSQKRSVFFRLQERNIQLHGLLDGCDCNRDKNAVTVELEKRLLQPEFAAFMEMAFAVSDAYEQKQISNLSVFETCCKAIILKHTGKDVQNISSFISDSTIPVPLQMALNTLIQLSDLK